MATSPSIFDSLVAQFGIVGARWEARYAESLGDEGVKPKHVALLEVLDEGAERSQVEIAARMQIQPSIVVALADDLEARGAVVRLRDSVDRRRQILRITPTGEQLLGRARTIVAELDQTILATIGADGGRVREALRALLVDEGLISSGSLGGSSST